MGSSVRRVPTRLGGRARAGVAVPRVVTPPSRRPAQLANPTLESGQGAGVLGYLPAAWTRGATATVRDLPQGAIGPVQEAAGVAPGFGRPTPYGAIGPPVSRRGTASSFPIRRAVPVTSPVSVRGA